MRLAAVILALAATPLAARDIPLGPPIACDLGKTCFIQQYVDHDPGPGWQDFTCGPRSYDGHKGTDYALPSFAAMRAGVDVLAAAPGVVLGVRNDMPDTGWSPEFAGRECGNGLVLDHGGGWQTQYCHMKQGSVTVSSGQRIAMGTVLGQVGYSGKTEFPHLHLSVRKDGAVVDPFEPDGRITCGAPETDVMWIDPPAFEPGGVIAVGLADGVPDYDTVKDGTAGLPELAADMPALVVWGYAFGALKGDILRLELTGPEGRIASHEALQTRNRAQFFQAAGRKLRGNGWPTGSYTGTVELVRDGQVVDRMETRMELR